MLAAVCERVQVLFPCSNVGRITVLYIQILGLRRTSLHFKTDSIEKNVLLAILIFLCISVILSLLAVMHVRK
jgi:hypothetical protein